MYSTSKWPSLSERGSGLPCMSRWRLWPLQRLWVVFVLLVAVILLVGERRGRPKQRRWVRQPRKAEMVAIRFVRDLHAYRGAGAYAGS